MRGWFPHDTADAHRGFTLIEMAVVVVILGILTGIVAVSYTFLQNFGNDTSAQETLQRVVTAQQSIAYDWGRYSPYGPDVRSAGTELNFISGTQPAEQGGQVSLGVGAINGQPASGWLGVAVESSSGECVTAVLAPADDATQPVFQSFDPATKPCSASEALSQFFSSAVPLEPDSASVKVPL